LDFLLEHFYLKVLQACRLGSTILRFDDYSRPIANNFRSHVVAISERGAVVPHSHYCIGADRFRSLDHNFESLLTSRFTHCDEGTHFATDYTFQVSF
jgi:hypothetical protein